LDEPRFSDGDWLKVWMYLWLKATHKAMPTIFKGERIILKPGQLVTSRRSIAHGTDVDESKVERVLRRMKIEQQLDWIGGNKSRLITLLNWEISQGQPEKVFEKTKSKQTPNEHKQECKNGEKKNDTSTLYNVTHCDDSQRPNLSYLRWREHYSTEQLEVIDLYNQICGSSGWRPIDRESFEVSELLTKLIPQNLCWEIIFQEAVRERDQGAKDYNTEKGNKLVRILYNCYYGSSPFRGISEARPYGGPGDDI
jgi:hypothetical protein